MAKIIRKIEDLLEEVESTVSFSTKLPTNQPAREASGGLSFPELLDFSFPKQLESTPIIQIGEVIYVGDGVVHASGLDKATVEEIIDIKTGSGIQKALILGIREDRVEAVVMGDYSKIKRGDQVKSTGSKLKTPVGEKLLGRVLNPLGEPLDHKGPIHADTYRDVEFPAPGVNDRKPVTKPLQTGIMVIDTTIPIGKGQRELVIGDRKTGKTRTMIDIISNQQGRNVYCVYVGVSVQGSKAKGIYELLEQRGALKYTTLVLAMADDPPSVQYIAPYVGSAIGEQFMYNGKDVLIIYDDLSKQAKAYRQVSLLLKRSPGRDAYPGDIFFLHSRLLERSSQLNDDLKGGSMTALPVAETQSGDVSDFIVTNLMSITDGHIYLDANLMHEGVLPAVDAGYSVSRIGGKVQSRLLQKSGELTQRTLIRYNEVKSFETINTEVSEDTIRDIKRGKRIKEVLSQSSDHNLDFDEEILVLMIANSSRMDHLELDHVITFKENIVDFYRKLDLKEFKKLCDTAKDVKEIDPFLDEIFNNFCKQYHLPLPRTTSLTQPDLGDISQPSDQPNPQESQEETKTGKPSS